MSLRPVRTSSPQGTAPEDIVARLRAQVDAVARVPERLVPVHPALRGILPGGGLRPGSAYGVDAAGSLLLALLAEPSRGGSWCGVIGVGDLGAEAAAAAGVELERLILVPAPGDAWLGTVAALTEVVPVIAVRPPARVGESDAARLQARLREHGTVLLVTGPWPRLEASFRVGDPRWAGLGEGYGLLAGREVTVTVVSKRAPVPRGVRLWLPDGTGRLAAAEPTGSVSRLRAVV